MKRITRILHNNKYNQKRIITTNVGTNINNPFYGIHRVEQAKIRIRKQKMFTKHKNVH